MSTKSDILRLLRREALTIRELADRLDVARNAVVLALQPLTADGLVAGRPRKEKRAGKPALEYTIVPGREDAGSAAYPAFAELLLKTLPEHLSRDQLDQIMRDIGRRMASHLAVDDGAAFDERLQAAIAFVDELGADATVSSGSEGVKVQSFSCPLGRAVRQQPCVCQAMAAFFAEATGGRVEQTCQHGDKLVCQFEIRR